MFAHLRMVIILTAIFLTLFGLTPIVVSAMYGGNPPAHIANLLNKQMDTWSWAVRNISGPFNPGPSASARPDEQRDGS